MSCVPILSLLVYPWLLRTILSWFFSMVTLITDIYYPTHEMLNADAENYSIICPFTYLQRLACQDWHVDTVEFLPMERQLMMELLDFCPYLAEYHPLLHYPGDLATRKQIFITSQQTTLKMAFLIITKCFWVG